MKNRNIILTTILLALGSLALPQWTQAVSPAPDGGYPGGNTAEGYLALGSVTTGVYNTGIGVYSLLSITDQSLCTAVGAGALFSNTGGTNTATGAGALLSNTTGTNNTANGTFALFSSTAGNDNTAIGDRALVVADNADGNTAVGSFALGVNTSGSLNTVIGAAALITNTTGSSNTAVGLNSLFSNNGDNNTAVGRGALGGNTSGNNNVALGFGAGSGVTTASNVICIGTNVAGNDVNDSCYIGNIFGDTSSGGTAVFVNTNGRLGTATSSRRFKDEIKPMNKASEMLFALKPVTFRYKKEIDSQGIPQFGLVAEDVEAVNPDLVVRDKEGKVNTVRYEAVNAMLLNEFLKEHRKVQEQGATIAELKKDFRATVAQLTARLEEQAAQIQRVSAHLEMKKPAPQMAANHP
jgi:endosialidase-like protein